jgi:2-oxoglutarate dehydrogenase E2 component (dihydrolipoamide succinyltransferase)
MGVSVSEGTITKWLRQVGDPIGRDEPLLEISTDKVDTEVPSPAEGVVLQILVAEGETVEVGQSSR